MTAAPPVVLVHGLATSAQRTWVETGLVALLTDEGREVHLIDLPGHGDTPMLEGSGWDHLDEWLARRLDDLAPEGSLDAVGFSLGARLLLGIAAASPRRFRRLVVAGVGANLFRHDDHDELAESLSTGAQNAEDHPIVRHFHELARASGTDPDAVVALLRANRRPLDESLAAIESEVLVALGDEDFAGPADPLMERLAPSARLEVLRGVDHFAAPKSMSFLDATLRFLGGD